MNQQNPGSSAKIAWRVSACLLGTTLASLVVVILLLNDRSSAGGGRLIERATDDPAVIQAAVDELVKRSSGIWDSFPDPDVGRVLQPNLRDRELRGAPVVSNSYGMREDEYELPKPEDVTRIVLLGDSYVFGFGIEAQDRLGVFLQQYLTARRGQDSEFTDVEVLHLALTSWNVISECAYVRRQLSELDPDLVVQVVVRNDLDDLAGVRGFGEMGFFSPQVRSHADGIIRQRIRFAADYAASSNFLAYGLDYESRQRFEDGARRIGRLATAIEERGGKYLLLVVFGELLDRGMQFLGTELREDQIGCVANAFMIDPAVWVNQEILHWNRGANERLARMLYGLIQERGLLPTLELSPWDEARTEVQAIHEAGLKENDAGEEWGRMFAEATDLIDSRLAFPLWSTDQARRIHGGIDGDGRVAPYASMILENDDGEVLELKTKAMPYPELKGSEVRVFVDEFEVGTFAQYSEEDADFEFPLPDAARERPFVSVRFSSADYIYDLEMRVICWAFNLSSVRID